MCGIAGIISNQVLVSNQLERLNNAVEKIAKRGPDAKGLENYGTAAIGHRRLSIIDTSDSSNQPMENDSGRYSIVFNGEIYNYKELKTELQEKGYAFKTNSDTEVLLQAYSCFGTNFLNKLNGFFAFAIFDKQEKTTLLARDRFGIKPLIYYKEENAFYFASEMKALLEFDIPREIDHTSLYTYLQLNYIPEPHSMIKDVKKLEPGHYLKIDAQNRTQKIPFYQIDYPLIERSYSNISYENAQSEFIKILERSIQRRLVADVPLGTFLSGGIDSSLITALASRNVDKLLTFSIGFKDDPHFDETEYALAVAKKFNTDHHVFSLSRKDLLGSLYETLEYIDEPFADSSALAVNALSRETKKYIKVALSGDGADEIFSGYHKHMGEFLMRKQGVKQKLVKSLAPVWSVMPKSRNSKLGNMFRKLDKFSAGSSLPKDERYWLWASLLNEAEAANLMIKSPQEGNYLRRKKELLSTIAKGSDFNDVLYTDMKLVLQSDMLRKVDLMSMANGLEVRTPFLDHELVNFAFNLPAEYKINSQMKKRLVQDAARPLLPEKLYNRPKKGFEVPLHAWLCNELQELIEEDLLSDDFIREQNLFNAAYVSELKKKLKSPDPEDAPANIWALLVFNSWWKKYIE
ncbi:MAG: asparagine synthase (glutamine-hydrolyzing) [Flavobacteriales bacterium]|nr:asparagine synthase (glutamine-hydrolyzing) [Flavobacteriales bacterium]